MSNKQLIQERINTRYTNPLKTNKRINDIANYIEKWKIKDVVVGISGGIDSAFVLKLLLAKEVKQFNIHTVFNIAMKHKMHVDLNLACSGDSASINVWFFGTICNTSTIIIILVSLKTPVYIWQHVFIHAHIPIKQSYVCNINSIVFGIVPISINSVQVIVISFNNRSIIYCWELNIHHDYAEFKTF